jgi:hypothetical protein
MPLPVCCCPPDDWNACNARNRDCISVAKVVADTVVPDVDELASPEDALVDAVDEAVSDAVVVVADDVVAVVADAVVSPSTDCRSLSTVCMAVTRVCSAAVSDADEDEDDVALLSWLSSAGGGGGGGGGPIIAVVASVEDPVADADDPVDDSPSEAAWVKAARISLLNRLNVPVSALLLSDELELLDTVAADVVVEDAASLEVDETD